MVTIATRTLLFGFIHVEKTLETYEILDVSLVVKLLPTLKHVINVDSQKSFTGL